MVASTFEVRVGSDNRGHFDLAMKIAWDACPGKKATHYTISTKHGMVLFWGNPDPDQGTTPLPYPMDLAAAAEFLWGWLKETDPKGEAVDHDGNNNKGWLLESSSDSKRLEGSSYAFLAVKPVWHEYWK